MVLGTAVTILEPRSTRRVSHSGRVSPVCVRIPGILSRGAKWATWAVVVKTRNPEETTKEFALFAKVRLPSAFAIWSLPVEDNPI